MKHMRWIPLVLALVLILGLVPGAAMASDLTSDLTVPETFGTEKLGVRINPLYEGLIREEDLGLSNRPVRPIDEAEKNAATYVTAQQAGVQMRQYMKNRTESFVLYVQDSSSDYEAVVDSVLATVFVHTGEPKEGDYLMWHYAGFDGSVAYGYKNGRYEYIITFEMAYYTTAAQEKALDTAISNLLRSLNVSNKTDYQKVCAVYDYICSNVTYDYANLEDESYLLKFSAYAAMVNKTAVCQGYALLFYRLMLELDIDARLIGGDGGGPHAWNIVKLGNVYYNVDSTWDAGVTDYEFFLRNTENFVGHARYLDYMGTQFHTDYPMSATDYVDGVAGEPEYYFVAGICGDDVYWGVNRDRELTVAGEGTTYDVAASGELTEISPWYYWTDGFEKVVVEEGVTSIGANLFWNMDNVTSVRLPGSLKEIGTSAFSACSKLSAITLPSGLESIGSRAFCEVPLKAVTIPNSVTTLGDEVFSWNTALTAVTLGNGLKTVGKDVFSECSNLSKLNMKYGLTVLGDYMFENCTALTTVTLPATLESIGNYAFYNTGLTQIVIPDSVTQIGSSAFERCSKMTSVTLGKGDTELGGNEFSRCTALSSVTMPDNITIIGWYTFNGCTSLKQIRLSKSLEQISNHAFAGTGLTSIALPDGLKRIASDAFRGCSGLTEVTIPSSVTHLGGFQGCQNLKKVNLPDSNVETIEGYAFYACRSLESFEFPESVTQIGGSAFQYCTSLKEIEVPDSVVSMSVAFSGCTGLETATLNLHGKLPGYAFSGCTALKNVTLGENITEIGVLAFRRCTALERIEIPGSVRTLGGQIFDSCSALKEILFHGEAPAFASDTFSTVTATAYYPGALSSWTDSVRQNYGGTITWAAGHTHSIVSVVSEPTCTERGYTAHTCSECGYSYKNTYVGALGHTEEEPQFISKADGHGYTCSVCGNVRPESCTFGEPTVLVEATIHNFGIREYTCSVCSGSYESRFLCRISGKSRVETAIAVADKLKEVLGKETFDTIIIANGNNFADALTGSYLANVRQAPILLHRSSGAALNEEYIRSNLSEGGIVYILGGTAAVPEEVEQSLLAGGYRVERLKGSSRYDTNLRILETAGVSDEEILICTGRNYADSLSASATGLPILMLNTGAEVLSEEQIAFLQSHAENAYTIIGGTAAVSETLEAELEAIVGEVDRISGKGREATSAAVAQRYLSNPEYVLLAYSRNFPDGLCGGPLAYALGAPLLLTTKGQEAPAAEYVAEYSINKGCILGGTAAVSEESVRIIVGE